MLWLFQWYARWNSLNFVYLVFAFTFLLRSQAGCNDTAKDFSTKAQEIEETELGARPEKMADLYYLKALIQDEVFLYILFSFYLFAFDTFASEY